MPPGIYVIENIENGKRYVGKGNSVENRMWQNHKRCTAINFAIKKYGDNIIRYIIEYCKKEDLIFWEQYYIKKWNTKAPFGYNLTDGGEGLLNPSDKTREKLRKANLGKHPSAETKEKMSKARIGDKNPNYGKSMPDEQRKKLRENHADVNGENNPRFGKKLKEATSQYYAVSKMITLGKYIYWVAGFTINHKRKHIGCFKTEIGAAKAYDKYIIENDFNRPLNFPEEYNKKEI